MASNWSFEIFSYQIQNAGMRQWFLGFVYTTSHVLWHRNRKSFSHFHLNTYWPNEMSWKNDLYLVILVNSLSNTECMCRQWFYGFVYTRSRVLWHSRSLYFYKSPSLAHLTNFVFKFRIQVSGNDSMDLFKQHHVCCDLSFECLSDRMDWVDQITFNSTFEWILCPIQTQSVRQCFHALY